MSLYDKNSPEEGCTCRLSLRADNPLRKCTYPCPNHDYTALKSHEEFRVRLTALEAEVARLRVMCALAPSRRRVPVPPWLDMDCVR